MSIITRINKAEKRIVDLYNKLKNLPSGGGASGDFIPLTGTEEGSPVTGNIELDGSNNPVKIISQSGTHSLTIDDIGTMSLECRESNFYSKFGVGSDYIGFYSDNPNFRGIEGHTDLSETYPTNKLIYAQRSYVDKANSYSTTEIKTNGTWIDGKPIYRRVITLNVSDFNLTDQTLGYVEIYLGYFIENIHDLINIINIYTNKNSDGEIWNGIISPYPNIKSYVFANTTLMLFDVNTKLPYVFSDYFVGTDFIRLTLEYTKTTD